MATGINRRYLALTGTSLLTVAGGSVFAAKAHKSSQAKDTFVKRMGQRFILEKQTYRFAGANIWYGAYLGATGPTGDRARLLKELDSLCALGISNLRVLASSELSPLKNSLDPAFTEQGKPYNRDLLNGLDFLLAEMGKRNMKAVLYLTNFWEWSGGMMAYQYYQTGKFVNNGDPAYPWPAFADLSALFYKSDPAINLYHSYVHMIVSRTNQITGNKYRDDPSIMAWQLSNEPRPTGSAENLSTMEPYYLNWIAKTAALIRSLDKVHMVSLGHEGLKGCLDSSQCVVDAHEHIDYLTAHIWPQNWSWIDVKDIPGSFEAGAEKVRKYIADHIALANQLNKPLVFEEFGFPRDNGAFEVGTPTVWRDKFYGMIYAEVEAAMKSGGPVSGSNFWAWGGTGRSLHADYVMQRGETAYLGDPPHEPQGWYSVFDQDMSTQALIRAHAARLKL